MKIDPPFWVQEWPIFTSACRDLKSRFFVTGNVKMILVQNCRNISNVENFKGDYQVASRKGRTSRYAFPKTATQLRTPSVSHAAADSYNIKC